MDKSIISPPITWFGSKSRLVKKITSYFPNHTTFVDVFGGSGAVLLGKKPSRVEVYNDINKKLVSLFRVLSDKNKSNELLKRLEYTPYSRSEFEFCRDNIEVETDEVELARMMIVVQRQSHGGLAKTWSHCIDASAVGCSASVRKFHAGIARIKDIHYRIRRVQVENLDWQELIEKYDRENTLFYLDPPYIHSTRVDGKYEYELNDNDHSQIVLVLQNIKGKAILSGYDHPIYNPLVESGWTRIAIETIAYSSRYREKPNRIEYLWISPNCKERVLLDEACELFVDLSNRQLHAYKIHKKRIFESEVLIRNAIKSLKRIDSKVTKAEVSRMTGISRVHLSRRYQHLFQ